MCAMLVAVVLALSLSPAISSGVGHSAHKGGVKLRGQVHQVAELEKGLVEILAAMDANEGDDYLTRRLWKIESSMAGTFQALPKNEYGRLAPRSVHYLVHHYFAKEHGWQIRGFETRHFHSEESSAGPVAVLEDHLPGALEELLQARRSHHGLSLADVVAMAALLERLIAQQSVGLLEAAYVWNKFNVSEPLAKKEFNILLSSVILLLRNPDEVDDFMEEGAPDIDEPVTEFQEDTLNNVHFEQRHRTNPFTERHYTFEEAKAITARLAHHYGRWSNSECQAMKEELMTLAPRSSGLVPLGRFYEHDMTNNFRFWESVEYLRQIGALEESNPHAPQVRIANYVTGPTNCIGRSSYYSVCCLDECKAIMSDLEGMIRAPAAPPARLVRAVEQVSSATVDAPRELSSELKAKLESIADHHTGSVPLHGRLFAQWLHLAFPNECAYPHVPQDLNASRMDHLLASNYVSSEEDMQAHVNASRERNHLAESPLASVWTDEEVLPLLERTESTSTLLPWVRIIAQLALFAGVLRMAFSGLQVARVARGGVDIKGKTASLPMYT